MRFTVVLAVLGFVVYSEAIPAVPIAAAEVLPQPVIRVARAPAEAIKSADKDLEGSESTYGVYPYYYPYYAYYKYPYYVYGR